MHIDDEIFYLNGESTLLSLRNGGGKSVLVQTMIAPFVSKRFRNLHDRTFSSYFTTRNPTYIIVEWALDGSPNRLLTGMMIRKKALQSDEDSNDDLEVINFIHEYGENNPYDIENIPFVEELDIGKKVKGFVQSKQLFEELKKDHLNKFNYFDMNSSSQAKNYFEKLKEYKINHKEWESIIRKINLEESGLSNLFKDTKNTNGLIEKWFLKSIEEKLNREENKMNNFKKIVFSYAKQYRENKSKIEKRAAINEFFDEEVKISEKATILKENIANISEFENQIANFIQYLELSLIDMCTKRDKIVEKVDEINQEMSELKYEELSIQIYENMDRKIDFEKSLHELTTHLNKDESVKQILINKAQILECAKIYEEYKEFSKEVQTLENDLSIIRKKEENFTPEINDLGYTMNLYYQEETKNNQEQIERSQDILNSLEEKSKTATVHLNSLRKQLNSISCLKGELRSKIKIYDSIEKKFNLRCHEQFTRNLLGFYEEGLFITKELEYEKRIISIRDILEESNKIIVETKELKKKGEREYSDTEREEVTTENNLNNAQERLKDFDEKLEETKNILKYIDFHEDQLFEKEIIMHIFDEKIKIMRESTGNLKLEKRIKEKELNMLQTGSISEFPKEIMEDFKSKDIYFTSGLEWLRNNNYSTEDNTKLVRNNPFLPYALIMNTKDLEKLAFNPIEKYMSSPIVIINREDLDSEVTLQETKLIKLGKVNFLISFNHKLIDELELKKLTEKKKESIEKIQSEIEKEDMDRILYEEKRNWIKFNSVDKKEYESSQKNAVLLEEQLNLFGNKLSTIRSQIDKRQSLIEGTEVTRNLESNNKKLIELWQKDFVELKADYQEYCLNSESNKELETKEKETEEKIHNIEKLIIDYMNKKESLAASKRQLLNEKESISKNLNLYRTYREGVRVLQDIEDIQSRYESLTKVFREDIKALKNNLEVAAARFKKKEVELTNRQNDYHLKDSQFQDEHYDSFEEQRVKIELREIGKQIESKNRYYHKMKSDILLKQRDIDHQLKELIEKFEKKEPKDKSELKVINFGEQIEQLKFEKNDHEKNLKEITNKVEVSTKNKDALSEYEFLEITKKKELVISFHAISTVRKELIRDYKESIELKNRSKNQLDKEVDYILRKELFYTDDFFKKPLETIRELTEVPVDLLENLNITVSSYHGLMDKLNADIELIEKEKDNVLQNLMDYIYEIHDNLGKIDRNSTIPLRGRPIKMLRIIVPDWENHQGVYKMRLAGLLDRVVKRVVDSLDRNESADDVISHEITTKNLYDEVVSIGNIEIKMYKIEENKEYQISWNDVAQNSGGEGFLSAFVILTCLLSYMGRDDTDIFAEKENSKVLIMDNPFAQTNAEHLLKPLMEMAKKSNTQLICFSGLGGDSIYNRFDNIYVLNLSSSKLKKNLTYLKAEQLKSKESTQELRLSNFQIDEEVEQRSLF